MTEETLFRVISLVIIMLVVGGGYYFKQLNSLADEKEGQTKVKKQAKKSAIRYSVISAVGYMVVILAVAGLTG